MTCEHARQWLSDLLDDALEGDRRVDVDAHLVSCADCRVELDRLRATVSALRGLDRPRAPAGFVDRVVERAHPVPWYRRLYAWLFLPLSVKLPAEVAAAVVIAGLAVLVWQRTPEIRDAALHRAIAELSDERRMVVVLRDLEGLSYEEIAAALELELGTVRSRLHRARMDLKDKMERFFS